MRAAPVGRGILNGFLLLCALVISVAPSRAAGSFTITSGSSLFVDRREPQPIQRAADDLAEDLREVFGRPVRIVHDPNEATPTTLWISQEFSLPKGVQKPSGWERLQLQAVSNPWPGSPAIHAVVLTGSDVRGAIYAIYQFSQEFLGVDPLYWWTDHDPSRRTKVEVPDDFSETQGPTFHYRGFFVNDEDLLTGWAPGEEKDGTGISLEVWNKIFETILRLKCDMVAPGTWIFPDEAQIKLAGWRGLIVTQHHAIPLGLNVARWPKDVPYSYSSHPEILERAWKNAAAAYPPDQEVLWTVGLRGLSDVTYAASDPSVRDNNQALGRLIGEAIADQMRIVRSLHPDARFITNLWQEGAGLVQQGYLTIPSEVSIVWADDGYGNLQDKGQVAAGQGAYYHVAMMNARANQLTEMVPVERIMSELGRYSKAGATEYLLFNTSDIRPVPMTIKAVAEVAWEGSPQAAAGGSEEFYRRWSSEEFGEKAASEVTTIYKEYFKAPARWGPEPPHEYGDQYYHSEARYMLLASMIDSPLYSIPSQAPFWVNPRIFGLTEEGGKERVRKAAEIEIQRCAEAQPRWDVLWKKAVDAEPLVAPERRPFYRAHVLAMIAINKESNRVLLLVARAIEAAGRGETSQARDAAEQALRAFDEIHRAETEAEYGKWKKWYAGDWLTGILRTRELVQIFLDRLDHPSSPLPPPILWSGWEAYYHIMHYEGKRAADVE